MITSLPHGIALCTGRKGRATSPPTIGANTHGTSTAAQQFGHVSMEEEQGLNKIFNQQRDSRHHDAFVVW